MTPRKSKKTDELPPNRLLLFPRKTGVRLQLGLSFAAADVLSDGDPQVPIAYAPVQRAGGSDVRDGRPTFLWMSESDWKAVGERMGWHLCAEGHRTD